MEIKIDIDFEKFRPQIEKIIKETVDRTMKEFWNGNVPIPVSHGFYPTIFPMPNNSWNIQHGT